MSFYCPVCNGMQRLNSICRKCRQEAEDCGRLSDFMGPYSPYRPIDDLKWTNGFNDLQHQQCVHIAYCTLCDDTYPVLVDEWG